MSLSIDQMAENWKQYRERVNQWFPNRADALNKMYDFYEDRMLTAPASSVNHYHNAFDGGYVDHVLRVMDCAQEVYESWARMGADVSNFEMEELMFAAMHHDLGKIGWPEAGGEIYQTNDSEWHRKNQGKLYINNPVNSFMTVPDRSLKLLADRGIKVSENEWYGIKLHDGMYEEANKPYYVGWNPDSALRTNISYVLHQADMMASRIEKETNHSAEEAYAPAPKAKKSTTLKEADKESLKNTFDQLFK